MSTKDTKRRTNRKEYSERSLSYNELKRLQEIYSEASSFTWEFEGEAKEYFKQLATLNRLIEYEQADIRNRIKENLGGNNDFVKKLIKDSRMLSRNDAVDMDNFARRSGDYAATGFLLENGLKGKEKPRVLQVASNYGPYLYYLKHNKGFNVIGVDTNKTAAEFAKQHGIDIIVGDASNMPLGNESVDAVLIARFLDPYYLSQFTFNIDDFITCVLDESYRVLVKRGICVTGLEVPIKNIMGSKFSQSTRLTDPQNGLLGGYVLIK